MKRNLNLRQIYGQEMVIQDEISRTKSGQVRNDLEVSRIDESDGHIKVVGPTPGLLQPPREREDLASMGMMGKYDNFIDEASEQNFLDKQDIAKKQLELQR